MSPEAAFEEAQESDDLSAYRGFISSYPDHPLSRQAKERVVELEEERRQREKEWEEQRVRELKEELATLDALPLGDYTLDDFRDEWTYSGIGDRQCLILGFSGNSRTVTYYLGIYTAPVSALYRPSKSLEQKALEGNHVDSLPSNATRVYADVSFAIADRALVEVKLR